MTQTVFVTGAAGFLGRRLLPRLLALGLTVRCLVRTAEQVEVILSQMSEEQKPRLTLLVGELTDREILKTALQQCDVIYHLAASLTGSRHTILEKTIEPTRVILEEAHAANVKRFVLVSSLAVYSAAALKTGKTLDETSPVEAFPERRDAYSAGKILQEKTVWEFSQQSGLPIVVVRPGVIYGPGRSLLSTRVGLKVGRWLLRMGGEQKLPYTYVDNCADAIALAGVTPDIDQLVINVIDDNLPTGKDLLRLMKKHGKKVRVLPIPRWSIAPLSAGVEFASLVTKGRFPKLLSLYQSRALWTPVDYSNQRAKTELGWSPGLPTSAALDLTTSTPSR